ncbi:hypothetical protein [Jatrophihabitans fulvus]
MAASKDELQKQLADVNDQIRTLGGEADAAFADTGGDDVAGMDSAEVAADLTMAQENYALLQPLYARRDELMRELGQA